MLDDLRNSSLFLDDDNAENDSSPTDAVSQQPVRSGDNNFLGMTAPQRFVLSLIFFMMVCILGAAALVLTSTVTLPF